MGEDTPVEGGGTPDDPGSVIDDLSAKVVALQEQVADLEAKADAAASESPEGLSERLATVEAALVRGLRMDLDQYDEAKIAAARSAAADEQADVPVAPVAKGEPEAS